MLEDILKLDVMRLVDALRPFAGEYENLSDRRLAQELVKEFDEGFSQWGWGEKNPPSPKLSDFVTFETGSN